MQVVCTRAGRAGRLVRWLAIAASAASLAGCQTARSWGQGCPGVYSGVRYFSNQIDTLPWDGKIFFGIDLPLSAVADTLMLPAAFFAEPRRPKGGFAPGCRWAEPTRDREGR